MRKKLCLEYALVPYQVTTQARNMRLSSQPLWWDQMHTASCRCRTCHSCASPTILVDILWYFVSMGAMAHNIICCSSEPPVPTGQNHGKLHQQQRNKARNSTVIGNPFAKSEPASVGGPPAGTIIGGLEWRSKNQENRGPCWRQDPVMCVTFPLQSKALQLCKWHFFKLQLKIHPNSWCHVNFSQLSPSNWVLNPCGGAICMGPVWGGEPVWRDIQLTKCTVSWKSFAHPTLHVVLRNLQFQPSIKKYVR